jgi:alginate O-acetyltransferase complex protein AlgI
VILLSWVPFAIGDWGQMLTFYGRLIGVGGKAINPVDYMGQIQMYGELILAGVVMATPLPKWIFHKIRKYWIADVLLFVLFWVVVYFIATSAQDPFTYY